MLCHVPGDQHHVDGSSRVRQTFVVFQAHIGCTGRLTCCRRVKPSTTDACRVSGTHWMYRVIDMLQRGQAVYDKRSAESTFLVLQRIERISELDSPRLLLLTRALWPPARAGQSQAHQDGARVPQPSGSTRVLLLPHEVEQPGAWHDWGRPRVWQHSRQILLW